MTHHLPLVGVVAAVFATGLTCGLGADLPPPDTGTVDIGFINVGDLSIERVDYAISGNGITPIAGSISLTDQSATPSAIVGGIPAGTQYLLELRAATTDGKQQCYGASPFDVTAGEAATVTLTLTCDSTSMVRTMTVNGMTDYCPSLASYSASSPSSAVGGAPITLMATAFSYYSDPPMFLWTASSGDLSAPHDSVSSYTCEVPGRQTLTITVTDGYCPDTATLDVTCLPAADAGAEVAARGEDGGML